MSDPYGRYVLKARGFWRGLVDRVRQKRRVGPAEDDRHRARIRLSAWKSKSLFNVSAVDGRVFAAGGKQGGRRLRTAGKARSEASILTAEVGLTGNTPPPPLPHRRRVSNHDLPDIVPRLSALHAHAVYSDSDESGASSNSAATVIYNPRSARRQSRGVVGGSPVAGRRRQNEERDVGESAESLNGALACTESEAARENKSGKGTERQTTAETKTQVDSLTLDRAEQRRGPVLERQTEFEKEPTPENERHESEPGLGPSRPRSASLLQVQPAPPLRLSPASERTARRNALKQAVLALRRVAQQHASRKSSSSSTESSGSSSGSASSSSGSSSSPGSSGSSGSPVSSESDFYSESELLTDSGDESPEDEPPPRRSRSVEDLLEFSRRRRALKQLFFQRSISLMETACCEGAEGGAGETGDGERHYRPGQASRVAALKATLLRRASREDQVGRDGTSLGVR